MDATKDRHNTVPPDKQKNIDNEESSIKYRSEYSPLRTPPPRNAVFLIDESTYQPVMPKTTHWSIGWADLMMTMFVLFLSMFIYQATHKDFLVSDELEIIGGETSDALEISQEGSGFPFVPVKPSAPLVTSGTVKKVESARLQDLDKEVFFDDPQGKSLEQIKENVLQPLPPLKKDGQDDIVDSPELVSKKADDGSLIEPGYPAPSAIEKVEPILLEDKKDPSTPPASNSYSEPVPPQPQKDVIHELFIINKENLENYDLGKFASIKLIPDKTVRIILTGDLLFATGSAELSQPAILSLRKIALAMENVPYMINVVGHTDNVPMRSQRFPSNWELSLTRASAVARFLIEDIGMNPNQFVVSGYSSYRPVYPNDNVVNRARNRRVEIIISKKLPQPSPANNQNFLQSETIQ